MLIASLRHLVETRIFVVLLLLDAARISFLIVFMLLDSLRRLVEPSIFIVLMLLAFLRLLVGSPSSPSYCSSSSRRSPFPSS